jgi:hypothetical protein
VHHLTHRRGAPDHALRRQDYADIDPPRGRASRSPRSPSPAPRRATPSRSPLRNRSRSPLRDGDEDRRMRDRSPPRFRDRSPPRGASYGR